jgi:dihydrofolate reductase
MARLIYGPLASLDGFVADENGNFDWAMPDEEVHSSVNDLQRTIGTFLLGRRMYEVLVAWETLPTEGEPDVVRDFAELWHATDKVVFSSTLKTPSSKRTRIETDFEPDAIRRLKESAAKDISIAGPHLAAEAFHAGLVDEVYLYLAPVVVGAGNRALPEGVRVNLELQDERRFHSGFVLLHYRVLT